MVGIKYTYIVYMYSDPKWCAPGRKYRGTCYSDEDIILMAKQYNKLNPGKKIALNQPTGKIYKILQASATECDKEYCLLSQPIVKTLPGKVRNSLNRAFNPPKPKKKYEWFDSDKIREKLSLYEDVYPDFKSFGAVPVDFETEGHMTVAKIGKMLKYGKDKFGVVINMDPHTEGGSHWAALWLYFNHKKRVLNIEYFDSVGKQPPDPIKQFIIRLEDKYEDYDINYWRNKVQHQKKNSECGMYSMYFVISKLEGRPIKRVISDDEMNGYRDVYFRPSLK